MSGVLAGKSPRTDAQWARDVEQRLKQLEQKTTVRVGEWTLTSRDGNLQASAPGKGTLFLDQLTGDVLAAIPDNRGSFVSADDLTKAVTGTAGPLENLASWLTAEWQKFLTPNSELNWANLKSQLPHWLTPSTLSAGAITSTPINYLADASFDAALVAPSGRWTRDGTVYRTSGWSAHITANGVEGSLRSNVVAVSDGQKITLTIHGATAGLTGTGPLLELTALPFTQDPDNPDNMIAGTAISLGTLTAAQVTGDLSDWEAPPTTGSPHSFTLTGSWVIEGADGIAMRITLHDAATAGDVWWDDGTYAFTGTIASAAIANLDDNLLAFTNKWQQLGQIVHGDLVTAIDTDVQRFKDWWSAITGSGDAGTVDPDSIQDVTVGTTEGPIASIVQQITDFLLQGRYGAATSGTGNDPSALTGLGTLPVESIIPIAPAASTEVTITQSGFGSENTSFGAVSTSWGGNPITADDDMAVAIVNCATTAGKGSSCQLAVGAQTLDMIPLAAVFGFGTLGNSPNLTAFVLPNPPPGVPTFTASSKGASVASLIAGTSLVLSGVGTVEDITFEVSNTDTNPTQSTTYAVDGSVVVNAQGTFGNSGDDSSLSSYTPSSDLLYHAGRHTVSLGVGGTFDQDLMVGAVQDPSSPTFGSTMGGKTSHTAWGSISIAFNPAAVAGKNLGAGFRRSRVATTGVNVTAGTQTLPLFFDTQDDNTDYLTYNAATGEVKVLVTGRYVIGIHILEKNTAFSHTVRALLYAGGSIIRKGHTLSVTSNASDTWAVNGNWPNVYLTAGTLLLPGIWSSKAINGLLVGSSGGVDTSWDITLSSRGLL